MTFALAAFFRPFVIAAFILLILIPVRLACEKWIPEGKLKRFLLYRIHNRW
jgi:hypothetical protein